jgi:glycosyltransferase involved in cell wall biosynthesis
MPQLGFWLVMKVCIVIYSYWPEAVGGAESQCRKLAGYLGDRGMECAVLTSRTRWDIPRTQYDGKTEIHRVPVAQLLCRSSWTKRTGRERDASPSTSDAIHTVGVVQRFVTAAVRFLNTILFSFGLWRHVRRHRHDIDIIHVHIASYFAGLCQWLGQRYGIPVVCKGAFIPVFEKVDAGLPFRRLIEKRRCELDFIALTEDMATELKGHGVADDRITVIPNAVAMPDETASPEQGKHILYIGNFSQGVSHKAFDVLFEAWVSVHQRHPDVRLVVAGRGDQAPWRTMLAAENALESVDFIGYQNDLSPYFRDAMLFVLPSRSEGVSNALLEAQSWGIPAVVSDIPGNRAVVKDAETGRIVAVDNAEALSNAMIEFIEDPSSRSVMGKNARLRMQAEFSPDIIVEKIVAVYRRLIEID